MSNIAPLFLSFISSLKDWNASQYFEEKTNSPRSYFALGAEDPSSWPLFLLLTESSLDLQANFPL